VIVRPEAEADLADAKDYYERQRDGLGTEFVKSIAETFERIERLPESHPDIHRGVRRALTRRFPFAIYYRIEGDEVIVIAVMHSRRDPRSWKSRV
jgi:plasmid stabilization system protein ParE